MCMGMDIGMGMDMGMGMGMCMCMCRSPMASLQKYYHVRPTYPRAYLQLPQPNAQVVGTPRREQRHLGGSE